MQGEKTLPATMDAYIAGFPKDVQALLQKLRKKIRATAPEAEERISYRIPAFAWNGMLVYFAAWKSHVGFYPASNAAFRAFKKELAPYEPAKGTAKFPLDRPLPLDLVGKIVAFRMRENLDRQSKKPKKPAKKTAEKSAKKPVKQSAKKAVKKKR